MRNILMVLLVFIILVFVGCGTATDSNLVGTWLWDEDTDFVYIFNDDGTGTRGWPGDTSTFTWSTSRTTLRIRCGSPNGLFGIRNERWTYSITGDNLRLTSQQARNMEYGYIRAY